MKTGDLIQLGALGLVAYIAFTRLSQAKQPVATVTSGLQPSQQVVNTPLDPDFGVTNPNDSTWGTAQNISTLTDWLGL